MSRMAISLKGLEAFHEHVEKPDISDTRLWIYADLFVSVPVLGFCRNVSVDLNQKLGDPYLTKRDS